MQIFWSPCAVLAEDDVDQCDAHAGGPGVLFPLVRCPCLAGEIARLTSEFPRQALPGAIPECPVVIGVNAWATRYLVSKMTYRV